MIFTRRAIPLAFLFALVAWAWLPPPASASEAPDPEIVGQLAEKVGEDIEQDVDHAGHDEVNTNPLEFQTDLAIWTAVIFLVLLAVLWKFAWGPIIAGLDKREEGIAEQIASAERNNEDSRTLLARYEEKLAQSEDEVHRMLEEAKRDAEKVGQQIVDKARDEAEAEHRRKLEEIEAAADVASKELAEKSATLAVELAGKIVAGRLDPATHAKLIQDAVSRFPSTEPGKN